MKGFSRDFDAMAFKISKYFQLETYLFLIDGLRWSSDDDDSSYEQAI